MDKVKLFHAELKDTTFKTGFTKLDTDVQVKDDGSFEIAGDLAKHLRRNSPFILTEEEYKAFNLQKGNSYTNSETGKFFNEEYVPVEHDPSVKFKGNVVQKEDPEKILNERDALRDENLALKSQLDDIAAARANDSDEDDDQAKDLEITKLKGEVTSLTDAKNLIQEAYDKQAKELKDVTSAYETVKEKLVDAEKKIEALEKEKSEAAKTAAENKTTDTKTSEKAKTGKDK
jgi:hypothetical protein